VNLFIQTNSFSVDSRARAGPGGPTKSIGRAGPGRVVVGEGRARPGGPQHFLGRFGPGPTAKNGPISRPVRHGQNEAFLGFFINENFGYSKEDCYVIELRKKLVEQKSIVVNQSVGRRKNE
jgi:hypothetical protein